MSSEAHVLARLMAVIEERKTSAPPRSYTATLFAGGIDKIGAKIIEEAAEVVDAAAETGDGGRDHLVHEAADLVYHLFAMLAYREVPLSALESKLAGRFGVSGLDEKASRRPAGRESDRAS